MTTKERPSFKVYPAEVTQFTGEFVKPFLNEPSTKYAPEGKYSTKFAVSSTDGACIELMKRVDVAIEHAREALFATIDAAYPIAEAAAFQKSKWITHYRPYKIEVNEETGEETGRVLWTFTRKASGVAQRTGEPWTANVMLWDGLGNAMDKSIQVWSGSTGRIRFKMQPYGNTPESGVSVRFNLLAAQILTIRNGGAGGGGFEGFEVDEDGFDSSDVVLPKEGTSGYVESSTPSSDEGGSGTYVNNITQF